MSLVKESLEERAVLQRIAPHLVTPIPFLMPLYKEGYDKKFKIRLGMLFYDLISSFSKVENAKYGIPRHSMLTAEQAIRQEPELLKDGLVGAVLYYECQISSPERLCLEFILTAASNGADVSNYAEAEKLNIENGAVKSVKVKDNLTGKRYEIKAKIVVNASGPWVDKLMQTYEPAHEQMVRGSKGIHIITKKISYIPIILTTKAGENVLIIPWREYSLIGTTDDFYKGNLDDVVAERDDIEKLVNKVNEVYGKKISVDDVIAAYAVERRLIKEEGKPETKVSRKYMIREEAIRGLMTVAGGKLTTARALAEKTVNIIVKRLGYDKKRRYNVACTTSKTPLYGNTEEYKAQQSNLPDLKSRIVHLIDNEMALTLQDVMLRRTDIATLGDPGPDVVSQIANIMMGHLKWNNARRTQEISDFNEKMRVRNR